MLAFSALVAGSFSLGSMAAPHIAPEALNAVRFVIAATILAVLVFSTGGMDRSALRAPWRYGVLALFLVAYFVLMFEGLKTGAPVSMAAVFTLTPLVAAGFGWLLLRQVLTARMAVALGIGGVGALWVIFRADFGALLAFGIGRGEVIYFIGCVAHAFYAPLVPRLNRGSVLRSLPLERLLPVPSSSWFSGGLRCWRQTGHRCLPSCGSPLPILRSLPAP